MSADQSQQEKPLAYRGRKLVHIIGTTMLAACILMLILGQTVWADRVQGPRGLLYWGWCFLLAIACIVVAMDDFMMVRRALKQTKRELFHRQFMSESFVKELREKKQPHDDRH